MADPRYDRGSLVTTQERCWMEMRRTAIAAVTKLDHLRSEADDERDQEMFRSVCHGMKDVIQAIEDRYGVRNRFPRSH